MTPSEAIALGQTLQELIATNRALAGVVEEQNIRLKSVIAAMKQTQYEFTRFASQIKMAVSRAAKAASDSQELDVSGIKTPIPPRDMG